MRGPSRNHAYAVRLSEAPDQVTDVKVAVRALMYIAMLSDASALLVLASGCQTAAFHRL